MSKLLISITLICSINLHAGSVLEVCAKAGGLKEWSTPREALCDILQSSSSPQVQGLTRETLSILNQITELRTDPLAGDYYASLDRLANQLNSDRNAEGVEAQGDLGEFIRRFESPANRQNQQLYFEGIKDIISKTVNGKKALDCFYSKDETFTDSVIEFNTTTPGTLLGTFNIRPVGQGKFQKVIELDLKNQSPARALSLITHEMMHACDSSAFAHDHNEIDRATENFTTAQQKLETKIYEIENRIRNDRSLRAEAKTLALEAASFLAMGFLEPEQEALFQAGELNSFQSLLRQRDEARRTLERAQQNKFHTNALSEIRAYQTINVEFFKELAEQSPRYFCDQLTPLCLRQWGAYELCTEPSESRNFYPK